MRKKRIGLIHATINSMEPILEAFKSLDDDVELINFMDEGIIYELNEKNYITNRMIMRLNELAGKAIESNVDAILFTCSSFSPYVPKIAKLLPVPVLSSDISMLKRAVEEEHIIVLATIKAAGPTTEKMIKEVAKENNLEPSVEVHVIEAAFHALQNGNPQQHDLLIQEKIKTYQQNGTIVLAQYSMARAVENFQENNILTGPKTGAEAIIKLAKSKY